PAALVRGDALALVELDADLLEPEALDRWPAPHRHEHEVGLYRLALAEVDAQAVAGFLDLLALLLEMERDPSPPELLRELLRGVRVLLRDQRREHLDDRHLGAEPPEDRRELAADDPAAENDQPARDPLLREETGRVDAAARVEARDRRAQRVGAGRDDRLLEGH